MLRLYDVQVKQEGKGNYRIENQHENARALVSDLAFLARRGYEAEIFYYLYNATEQQARSVLENPFMLQLRKSKHVTLEDRTYRSLGICKTLQFRFDAGSPAPEHAGLQM